jgi:kumamolisin
MPGAKAAGKPDPNEPIEVTVRLRRRGRKQPSDEDLMKLGGTPPSERPVVGREELAAEQAADPADIARVEAFAHAHGLTVASSNPAQYLLRLRGTAASLSEAFGVTLRHYTKGRDLTYRGRTGKIYIPKDLQGIVVGVHGLDNRPVAKPHCRFLRPVGKSATKTEAARPRNAPDGSLATPDVARLYNFPPKLTGKGQCIGLIELNDIDRTGKPTGTGYAVSDIQAYFKSIGVPQPTVVPVSVDNGANIPGPDPNADGEVTLDIEVAGAVAPGATIAVYFAPNTTKGFIDALNSAIHDTQRRPSVISISWGGPEDPHGQVDRQFTDGLNQAIKDAAALGVTVLCAAGDDGSADMGEDPKQGPVWDKKPHADFPASSPFAVACGGTKLTGSNQTIASEVIWNEGRKHGAGGGGVSNVFPLPSYQSTAGVPKSPKGKAGRGVPDLAANADPVTGYQVFLQGRNHVIGGTSAVAPLLAGLVALLNENLSKASPGKTVGFVNPFLYNSAAAIFRDIIQGNNDIEGNLKGKYAAGPGWDACSGLGVPDGQKLLTNL